MASVSNTYIAGYSEDIARAGAVVEGMSEEQGQLGLSREEPEQGPGR